MDNEVPSEVISLCLYRNLLTNSSYIGNSKNSKCPYISDCELVAQFYVINPQFSTFPDGLELLGIKNSESGYVSEDISAVYDPFHIQKNMITFLTWMEPVPYGTPLYIWKLGEKLIITFDNTRPENYSPLGFSPIYVLMDPRTKAKRIKGNSESEFRIVDNRPVFTFGNYQGRCVPMPNGDTLGKCLVLYSKDILDLKRLNKQPDLLSYIEYTYPRISPDKYTIEILIISVIISILIIVGLSTSARFS